MAYIPNSGSVVAFQSDPTKLVGTVSVVGNLSPSSISGVGVFNVNHIGNGSITAVQGTPPWVVQLTSGSVITTGGNSSVQVVGLMPPQSVSGVGIFNTNNIGNGSMITVGQGSMAVAIVSGSIAATFTPPANQSVSGEVNVIQTTNPWIVQLTSGSVITTGGNSSVQVVGVMPPQSVSGVGLFNVNHIGNGSMATVAYQLAGSVLAVSGTFVTGNSSIQVVGAVPPTSVSGVGLFNTNHTGSGSVFTVSLGSIATAPSPASVSGVGIFNTNHTGNGSVITVWQTPSIVGTYAEDAAHTTADKGVFVLGVRNDTMSSITSADGDYSPFAIGPTGEVISTNAPMTKWVQAQTSVMYGVSVQAIAAQGASIFTYITGVQVVNASANNAIVKFTGGLGSVLAWTTAPANGGSNVVFSNPLKTGENSGFSASISGVASVYLSAQGFISKT